MNHTDYRCGLSITEVVLYTKTTNGTPESALKVPLFQNILIREVCHVTRVYNVTTISVLMLLQVTLYINTSTNR